MQLHLQKKAEKVAERAYEELPDRTASDTHGEAAVEPAHDNVSILFIGVDDSDTRHQGDGNSRSDALLLATLNHKEQVCETCQYST